MKKQVQQNSGTRLVYFYTFLAELISLIWGYHLAVISGAMLILVDRFALDIVWQQMIATASIVGGAVSLIPAGYLVHTFGRKKLILGANIIICVGSIMTAVADGKEVILIGRFVTGIGIGIPSLAVPMYVSECAPAKIRGRLGSLTQLMLNGGMFLSAVMGGTFNAVPSGWRYIFGLPCIVGLIQFFGFLFAPETPRWLMDNGRADEARAVLERLRDSPDDVVTEMQDIQRTINDAKCILSSASQTAMVLVKVFKSVPVRRALILSVCLAIIFQVTGIAAVVAYSGSIIKMAGFDSGNTAWLATVPFAVQFLATFISTCLVDRVGRKKLYVGANIGLFFSMTVIGLGFYLSTIHSPNVSVSIPETYSNGTNITDCNFRTCRDCIKSTSIRCGFCFDAITSGTCVPVYDNGSALGGRCFEKNTLSKSEFKLETNVCPTGYSWIPVLGLSLFLLAFGSGAGVIWIIISEVFPLWARSICSSIATETIWIFQIVTSITFLTVADAITVHGIFWLYAASALCAVIYTCIYLPETRGTSLERVEMLFSTSKELDASSDARHMEGQAEHQIHTDSV